MFNVGKISKKQKLVIFDFDGVIVDSLKVIAEFDKWLYPTLTEEEWEDTHRGNYFVKMLPHEHKRRNASQEEITTRRDEFYKNKNEAEIFLGMKECILQIPTDIICVINTTSKFDGCSRLLNKASLLNRFSYLATKEVSTSKKEKFKILLNKFHITSSNALFITDTIGDLLEASSLEIKTICVTWGVHSREDFLEYGPHKIAETPQELLTSIQQFAED